MVIEIDARGFAFSGLPTEDQPPLLIHPNRTESRKVATQFLEMVAGRHPQILITRRVVKHLKPAEQPVLDIGGYVSRSEIVYEKSA
jgi:hypothetical protein